LRFSALFYGEACFPEWRFTTLDNARKRLNFPVLRGILDAGKNRFEPLRKSRAFSFTPASALFICLPVGKEECGMCAFKSRSEPLGDKRGKTLVPLLLVLLLLIQGGLIARFGQEKRWFHEDEIATYELSNLPGGFLHLTDGYMETWKPGSFYQGVLTASGQTAFHYSIPYHNQESDVHPPLYYFVIHTVSSLVPGTFSKWIGIVPNILFALLSTLLLFGIAERLFGSGVLALITAAAWALSVGAMGMAVFIRMYSMLTFFCLLLIWLHLRTLDGRGPLGWGSLSALPACTVLGILTQYYFLIFCFFLCGSCFFYLAFAKRWKDLWKYTVAEFGAVALSVFLFPFMIQHIFYGYRGKQAFQNAAQAEGYAEHVREILSLIDRELCGGWAKQLLLLFGAAVVLCAVMGLTAACRNGGGRPAALPLQPARIWLLAASALATAGYGMTVVRVAPYRVDRYYMCIYPLLVLLMVSAACFVGKCLIKDKRLLPPVLALLFLAVTGNGYRTQDVPYLYREYTERAESLAAYGDRPALILNGTYLWAPDRWVPEYGRLQAVYRCQKNDFSGLAQAAEAYDLSGGFLLYAVGLEGYTDEALFAEIENYLPIGSRALVTDNGCRVYWCALEEG